MMITRCQELHVKKNCAYAKVAFRVWNMSVNNNKNVHVSRNGRPAFVVHIRGALTCKLLG